MKLKYRWPTSCRLVVILALAASGAHAAGTDYKIDRHLMRVLTEDAESTAPFFVVFGDRAQLDAAYRIRDWDARGRYVVQTLQATANRSQGAVRGYLQGRRLAFTPFWIENKIFVPKGTLELARALAGRPEVAAILPEVVYQIPQLQAGGNPVVQAVEWNISKIRADQAWNTTRGEGSVVANIDSGVQYSHPALVRQYRGNLSSVFSHAGNWKDPTGFCGANPCDNNGHGTHTMGTMVGDDGGANKIGVAPGAKWVACKGCITSSCFGSHLVACAQWILDPRENNSGSDRPHVVNNSWGGGQGDTWYRSWVQQWRAAGVFPAFSNGNSGPACGTAGSPGDYPESFASGAADINDNIASFSSRGPSAFGEIKPNLTAPGVSVRSSVPTNTYGTGSGTSMASPHVGGTVALVWSANASLRGNVSGTETLLKNAAVVRTTSETCGGIPANTSPNNTFGWGLLDAFATVQAGVGEPVNQPPTVTINSPANGSSFNCPVTVNFTGTASDPEDGILTAAIAWTDNGSSFWTGGTPFKDYTCVETGNHNIVAKVTDSKGTSSTDTITISIVDANWPVAPSNLTATASGSTVLLTWQDNSAAASQFKVERKDKGGWNVIYTTAANATSHSDSPGKGNWQYRVREFNANGESDPSNIASARVR